MNPTTTSPCALSRFACGLLVAALVQNARAVPVNGDIDFKGSGTGTPTTTVGVTTSTLTFNNPMTVNTHTGDFGSVPAGTAATFAPISWTGQGSAAVLTSMNSPEWSFAFAGTTYQFNLLSLASATMNPGAGTVSLSGVGFVFMTGAIMRDPTPFVFTLQGPSDNFAFTFSPTAGAAVPDRASTIVLLGLALVGAETLRRRWRVA